MKVKIKLNDGTEYVIEHTDKVSILRIVSKCVNRGFYCDYIDTICTLLPKNREREIIKGTKLYQSVYFEIGYSTYHIAGECNYTDYDLTVYRKAREVFETLEKTYKRASQVGSISACEEPLTLPDFEIEWQGGKYGTCPERDAEIDDARRKYEEA